LPIIEGNGRLMAKHVAELGIWAMCQQINIQRIGTINSICSNKNFSGHVVFKKFAQR